MKKQFLLSVLFMLMLVACDSMCCTNRSIQNEELKSIDTIETKNFYNLPESARVQMIQAGKFPGGPNWTSFLEEMHG